MLSFTPIGFFRGAVTDAAAAPRQGAAAPGACGNGSLIDSSANIIAAKIAEKSGQKVTFGGFTKIGFTIMIGTVCDAAVFAMVDNHEAHKPIAVETVKSELKLDAAALSAAAEKK